MSFSSHKNTTNELELGIQLSGEATRKYFIGADGDGNREDQVLKSQRREQKKRTGIGRHVGPMWRPSAVEIFYYLQG